MFTTHEEKVEKFYRHGSESRGHQDGGFLSFGYWTDASFNYHQAVESLINHVLQSEKPMNNGMVLNVACGYGSETIKIYDRIKPEKIMAIDITDSHIEFAKTRIENTNLSDRIEFEKMDACAMTYKPFSFQYVIGVEGPAHFKTRKVFLQKAYEVLKNNGVLLMSDIIVNNKVVQKNLFNRIIANFCAKHWFMPKENWMSIEEIIEMIKEIGFKVDFYEGLGNDVYPGFSRFNLRWTSLVNAIRTRGLYIGVALTFISWLLGYVHRRKMIDYIFVRAVK